MYECAYRYRPCAPRLTVPSLGQGYTTTSNAKYEIASLTKRQLVDPSES